MNLGKNTLINIIGAIVPLVVTIITVPIFLSLIGIERYGVLAIIWLLLSYFSFFDFGFGRAVAQRMAFFSNANNIERSNLLWTALSITFLLGIIGGAVLWVSADYIMNNIVEMAVSNRKEAIQGVFWLIVALPVLLPSTVLQGALQGRQFFLELNIISIVGSVLGQVLPLIVAIAGYVDLESLVKASLLAKLIMFVLLFLQSKRSITLVGFPLIDRSHLRPLLTYGGWISILSIMAPILTMIDRLFIAAMSGAKFVAYYTVPFNLVSNALVISSSLHRAIFPLLVVKDKKEGDILAEEGTKNLVSIMTVMVIIGLIFVDPFLILWLGKEFMLHSSGVGEILLIGIWLNGIVYVYHAQLLAAESPKKLVIIYLLEIPLYLASLWAGLKFFGIQGAAAAWVFRVAIDTSIILYLSSVLLKTLYYALVPFGIVIVTFGVVILLDNSFLRWGLSIILLILALVYERRQIVSLLEMLKRLKTK